jgi:hypothetical protein
VLERRLSDGLGRLMDEPLGCPAGEDAFGSEAEMTMTTLVVLMTALSDQRNGPARTLAPDGRPTAGLAPSVARAGVTCALRVVHIPPAFDSGIFARLPRRFGDVIAGDEAMVRDSLSPCAGVAGRRVSGAGTGER